MPTLQPLSVAARLRWADDPPGARPGCLQADAETGLNLCIL